MRLLLLGLGLLGLASCAAIPRLAEAVRTVDAFDRALAVGDEAQVQALLAPDVLIYESGGQEASREEYAAHHLRADIAFMSGKRRTMIDRRHGASGDWAWVATRSRISGKHKKKPIDLLSTETLVLRRQPEGWRIVHIHWSSQPAPTK